MSTTTAGRNLLAVLLASLGFFPFRGLSVLSVPFEHRKKKRAHLSFSLLCSIEYLRFSRGYIIGLSSYAYAPMHPSQHAKTSIAETPLSAFFEQTRSGCSPPHPAPPLSALLLLRVLFQPYIIALIANLLAPIKQGTLFQYFKFQGQDEHILACFNGESFCREVICLLTVRYRYATRRKVRPASTTPRVPQ